MTPAVIRAWGIGRDKGAVPLPIGPESRHTLGLLSRAATYLANRLGRWRLSYSPSQAAASMGSPSGGGGGGLAREYPTPSICELTLAARAQALDDANAGNLWRAADLTMAAITEDGKIEGIVKTISHGIPRLPRRFVGPPELVQALEGVNAGGPEDRRGMFGEICPEPEVAKMLEWGGVLGVALVQKIPVAPSGKWGAYRPTFRIKTWHSRWLRYDHTRDDWRITTRGGGQLWLSEHADQFALFRPHGETKPWELAHWKYVTKCALMARDAEFDRARHSALNGPFLLGMGGPRTSPKNLTDMATVLATMERRGRIVVQDGEDVQVRAPPAGDMGGVYQAILKDSRDEVAYGLLGNVVMTEGGKGFSSGDVWERMTQSRIDFYASALERFLQTFVIDAWAIDNAGSPVVGILYETVNKASASNDNAAAKPPSPGATLLNQPEASGQNIQIAPDAVLNGAQIQAAEDIILAVQAGTLSRDSGLALLRTGFNMTSEKALEIMGDAGIKPVQVAA